jgi:hypothetical protein
MSYLLSFGSCSSLGWFYCPSLREIRRHFWEYLRCILRREKFDIDIRPVPPLVRRRQHRPINHERQYPRVVRCRNNRNP